MRVFMATTLLVLLPGFAAAQANRHYAKDLRSPAYDPNEPIRPTFSLAKATEYLDVAAQDWMHAKSCGGCHANFAYMMVRPRLSQEMPAVFDDTRRFLEKRVERGVRLDADWPVPLRGEVVSLAFALAVDDARAGNLQDKTKQALDLMWKIRQKNKRWPVDGCGGGGSVVELRSNYLFTLAIVATNVAPGGYAQSKRVRDELTKTNTFPKPYRSNKRGGFLEHDAVALWASAHHNGILTGAQRDLIIKQLLARQNNDGGWSMASLHAYVWKEPYPTTKEFTQSDGYHTGFIVYVLRQTGLPADRPEMRRAVKWLRSNQRASGRWFTPVYSAGETTEAQFGTRDFYMQNNGTAFALLALDACGALKAEPARSPRLRLEPTLRGGLRLID